MTDAELRRRLADNLAAVEARIVSACVRAGRQRDDVTLIAVTKYVSIHVAGILHDLGVRDLGESRPQELWKKAAALPATVVWHLIGHLQRNKIDKTLPLVSYIHSLDSMRLLEAIETEAARQNRRANVLVEINLSGEDNKTGLPADQLQALLAAATNLPHIGVAGLMTMAARDEPEHCRPVFAALHQITGNGSLRSMGMSNDFEVAIEEGATHIRLGSVLYDGIPEENLRT